MKKDENYAIDQKTTVPTSARTHSARVAAGLLGPEGVAVHDLSRGTGGGDEGVRRNSR